MKNSRPIRFRAWDKKHLKIWPIADVDNEHSCALNGYDILGNSYEKMGGEEPEEDLILLQFTGFKDKNGKEIHEGDIYKTKSPKKYMVMFEEGAFVGGESEGDCIPLGWKCDDGGLAKEDDMSWLEVIGNIYENPELVHNSQKH